MHRCLLPIAVEHLACGSGLVNIYNFLREANPSGRPADQLQEERDPPSIGKAAMAVCAFLHSVSQSVSPSVHTQIMHDSTALFVMS